MKKIASWLLTCQSCRILTNFLVRMGPETGGAAQSRQCRRLKAAAM